MNRNQFQINKNLNRIQNRIQNPSPRKKRKQMVPLLRNDFISLLILFYFVLFVYWTPTTDIQGRLKSTSYMYWTNYMWRCSYLQQFFQRKQQILKTFEIAKDNQHFPPHWHLPPPMRGQRWPIKTKQTRRTRCVALGHKPTDFSCLHLIPQPLFVISCLHADSIGSGWVVFFIDVNVVVICKRMLISKFQTFSKLRVHSTKLIRPSQSACSSGMPPLISGWRWPAMMWGVICKGCPFPKFKQFQT